MRVEFKTTVFAERVEPVNVEYVAYTVWRVEQRRVEPMSVEFQTPVFIVKVDPAIIEYPTFTAFTVLPVIVD